MFRIALKGIMGRKARLLLTSLAVILGTSFLSGTSVFTATLNRTFDNLFSDVFRNVDAYVRSSSVIDAGFGDEQRQRITVDLVDLVRKVPGVSDVAPDIAAFARIVGKDGKPLGSDGRGPPTFGSIAVEFKGQLWTIKQGKFPSGSTEVAIDEASAKTGKYSIGDQVKVVAQSGSRTFTLVGIASYGDVRSPGGATFALFDQPTASEFLAKPGFIDSILITGDGSIDDATLAQRIQASLASEYKTETLTGAQITAETQDEIGTALGFFGILLKTFSFIALGVGCFVIYNVFSISAAQRQRENALLRAIGASKKQITRAMLIEAVFIGLFGSIVGLFAGLGLSKGLTGLLRALSIDVPSGGLVLPASAIRETLIIGLVVTVLSAWLPARRAGRVPPLAAMRESILETPGEGNKRLTIALITMALGVGVVGAVIAGASNSLLGIGILLVFIATIILGPVIARPVALFLGRPAARFRGVSGVMARQNAARNPKRTSRTAAPVLIGVALVVAVTAMASSIKGQINDVFSKQFTGDFVISTNAQLGFGGLSPSLADDINKLPEVDRASGLGILTVKIDGKGQFLSTVNPSTIDGVFNIGLTSGTYNDLSANSIFVSEKKAKRNLYTLGSQVTLTLSDETSRKLTIAGIYDLDQIGDYVVSRDVIASSSVANFDIAVYIKLKSGVSESDARLALQKAVETYGQGTLLSKSEYIKDRAGIVNQLLGLIYGLLFLSVIISIVGIIITLLLSVFERQREIGLLRAVGMTKGQVRTTVRWESVITSLLGAVVGILLGIGLGWVIVFALRDQGLTTFSLPVGSTILIMIMSFVVGVLAAIYPAWRATRVNILEALTTN